MSQTLPLAVFSGTADRLAKQILLIEAGLAAASAEGGGDHFERVTLTDDYHIEVALITPAHNLDEALATINAFGSFSTAAAYISAIEAHYRTVGGVSNLAALLTMSGVTVSDAFWRAANLYAGMNLPATQVFTDVAVELGSIVRAGGSWTFTDGLAIGAGSGNASATNHAPQNIEAYVPAAITIGAASVNINVTVLEDDGITTSTRQILVPNGSSAGTTVVVTSGTDLALDVTNVTVLGGTNGDQVKFRSIPTRSVAL